MIQHLKNLDKVIPDDLLAQKLFDIDEQRSNLTIQKNQYQSLIDNVNDIIGPMLQPFGLNIGENFIKAMGWDEKLKEIQAELDNLDVEQKETQDEQFNNAIAATERRLDALKVEEQGLLDTLDNDKIPKSVGLYEKLIKNITDQ